MILHTRPFVGQRNALSFLLQSGRSKLGKHRCTQGWGEVGVPSGGTQAPPPLDFQPVCIYVGKSHYFQLAFRGLPVK